MSDTNNQPDPNTLDPNDPNHPDHPDNPANKSKKTGDSDDDMIKKLVEERVAEQLKDVKIKLDNAYAARDEALKKTKELEGKQKEEHLKRLEEEGKHKEILELKLAEERAAREVLEKRNTELSRDVSVRAALNGLDFRNEKAADIAYREIVSQLVQKDDGSWMHKSGISINDYIEAFSKDEDQSFLFKVKTNNGGGSSSNNTRGTNTTENPKSLFSMSQEEVLKLAKEGKLPRK